MGRVSCFREEWAERPGEETWTKPLRQGDMRRSRPLPNKAKERPQMRGFAPHFVRRFGKPAKFHIRSRIF